MLRSFIIFIVQSRQYVLLKYKMTDNLINLGHALTDFIEIDVKHRDLLECSKSNSSIK